MGVAEITKIEKLLSASRILAIVEKSYNTF